MVPVKVTFTNMKRNDELDILVKNVLKTHCSEATEPFGVLVGKCLGPDLEKVVCVENHMYLCVKTNNIFVLIRDTALDIRVLISMWDAAPVTLPKLKVSLICDAVKE